MSGVLRVADLFAGAGGTTTGVLLAAESLGLRAEAVAVNHWPTAVATHTENHREVRHYCADIQTVDPLDVVRDGELDLLWASPECVHFSRARGGKPVNEQRRSGADWILEWLRKVRVRCLIVENVEEWLSWGDVDENGRPVSKTRGKLFVRWWKQLQLLGYRAEYRVLNAADFGDATTRKRLFVQARNDGRPIVWPEPTHSKTGSADLFGTLKRWRPAREIIDWSDLGRSILDRAKPLSLKTRLRIARGAQKFWGLLAPLYIRLLGLPEADERRFVERCADGPIKAFILGRFSSPTAHDVEAPAPTVARIGLAWPSAEPFTFGNRNNAAPKGPDEPIATVTTATGGGVYVASPQAEPFVVGQQSDAAARSADEPIPTVATAGVVRVFSPTAAPFLDVYYQTGVADSVDEPLSTATTKPRHALVSPVVVPYGPRAEGRSADDPLPTVMTKDRLGVASPVADAFAVPYYGEAPGQMERVVDLDEPLDTVTTAGRFATVVPIATVVPFGFAGREGQEPRVHAIDEPTPTISAQGHLHLATATLEAIRAAIGRVDPRRLVLIDGVLHVLDILFRMLKPEELAAAMGFPSGYRFHGTKTDIVRQIGNAVCVGVARALVLAMFGGDAEAFKRVRAAYDEALRAVGG